MLAYVFWHWPSFDVPPADYETLQRAFHSALASAAPDGFVSSCVFRLEGDAPWLGGTPAYADWYVLESSAAIDGLNVAAVSGPCERPHAEVARAMAAGAGSLLALRGPDPVSADRASADVASARHATFLTKPRPMSYEDFYSSVAPFSAPPSTLWRRALVLGPTPEFALLSGFAGGASAELQPLTLRLTPVNKG